MKSQSIDQSLCPFCKNENKCMAESSASCWCVKTEFPPELLELVPTELKNQSCICNDCIQLFGDDPVAFTKSQ